MPPVGPSSCPRLHCVLSCVPARYRCAATPTSTGGPETTVSGPPRSVTGATSVHLHDLEIRAGEAAVLRQAGRPVRGDAVQPPRGARTRPAAEELDHAVALVHHLPLRPGKHAAG